MTVPQQVSRHWKQFGEKVTGCTNSPHMVRCISGFCGTAIAVPYKVDLSRKFAHIPLLSANNTIVPHIKQEGKMDNESNRHRPAG